MKQSLLIAALFLGLSSQAQLTNTNQLTIGDSRDYYTLDSSATDYAAVTGTGVTWDYSGIGGYMGATANTNDVIDASTGSHPTDFPGSAMQEEFANGVQTFFNNVGDQVIVDGFVFTTGGQDIIVKYDVDALLALDLPMNVGESYNDPIEGVATVEALGGIPINLTGDADVSCDGSGTLIIGTNSYTNCIRVHTIESTSGLLVGQPVDITRESYVYYDLDDANPMPIFRHDAVLATVDGGGSFGFAAVYSKDNITGSYVNVDENETSSLSVYPNPAVDVVNISVDGSADEITVFNAAGQIVYTTNNVQSLQTLDVSDFEAGIYLVQIKSDTGLSTERLTVK